MKIRILLPLLAATLLRAQEPLPQHDPGNGLDFEPKLILDGTRAAVLSSASPAPEERLKKCQTALLQAQQRAADSNQLFKEGVLARVEIEARYLAVVHAQVDVAEAVLAVASTRADAVKRSLDAREGSQADLDAANAAATAARQQATHAQADWARAELDAALIDLTRKRKLYSEGVCSRREVQLAEDRVALLNGAPSNGSSSLSRP